MKKLLTFVFLFLMTNTAVAAVESGAAAPDFSLPGSDGETYTLSDYKGKHVVLEWINPDCPFVKKHYGSENMQKLQKVYTAKGVKWFSIASSAPGKQGHYSAEEWQKITADSNAKPTAVLLDPDGTVGKLYGAKTTPHMYVINPSGTLVYQGAIDNIPSVFAQDVPKAKNYVTQVLNDILSGQQARTTATKAYGCSVKYA